MKRIVLTLLVLAFGYGLNDWINWTFADGGSQILFWASHIGPDKPFTPLVGFLEDYVYGRFRCGNSMVYKWTDVCKVCGDCR